MDGSNNSRNDAAPSQERDNDSHLAILQLQLDDLRYSLQYDNLDIGSRAAIEWQIQELESLIEEGNGVEDFVQATRQPDLGPPPVTDVQTTESAEPVPPPQDGTAQLHECLICVAQRTQEETVTMPCQHRYCTQCLRNLLRDSLRDETLFPPRCCERVPETTIKLVMGRQFMAQYRAKRIEFETQISNRIYCCNPHCARFLGPKQRNKSITRRVCEHCGVGTCTRCRAMAQAEGEDYHVYCVPGEHDQTFLEAVRDAGYQQCFNCHRWVELNFGCNHMTCLCGSEFCYACGRPWKTCTCLQWHEEMLYDRAARIVDRPGGRHPRTVERRRQRIENMVEHLRAHHNCQHEGKWKRIHRAWRCEECGERRRNLMQCRHCHLRACQRCSINRRPLRHNQRAQEALPGP